MVHIGNELFIQYILVYLNCFKVSFNVSCLKYKFLIGFIELGCFSNS